MADRKGRLNCQVVIHKLVVKYRGGFCNYISSGDAAKKSIQEFRVKLI